MNSIVINAKDKKELKFITELLNRLGINNISEEEYDFQKRFEARKGFARLVNESPKIDITDEEIDEIVEEVRAKRYAEQNNH